MIRVIASSIGTVLEQIIHDETGVATSCPECKEDVANLNRMCPCEVLDKITKHAGRITNRAMSRNQPWYIRLTSKHMPKFATAVVSEWITQACERHISGEYSVTTIWQIDAEELRAVRSRIPVMIPTPERYVGKLHAVTSLNPNPARQARQMKCLESLRLIGIPVIAVNTSEEFAAMSAAMNALVIPYVSQDVTADYDRATQKVYTLIQVGRATGLPFLLINSDIEIYGDYALIDAAIDCRDKLTIGVRYNHVADQDRKNAILEPCGLDAFFMTPDMADTVPDLPFAIGKPVWDYWLPHHFRELGYSFRWIDTPCFFHKVHEVMWSQMEWDIGSKWLADHYGLTLEYNSMKFRDSLEVLI